MIIKNCKRVNKKIIKSVKKGTLDTTSSEHSFTMEIENIFQKNILPTNS